MSHSLETVNYKLPLFADDDVPSWLGDFNGAMQNVDTTMKDVADSNTNVSAQVIAFSNRLEVDEGKITANEQAVKDNAAAMQELTEQVTTKAPINHANANNLYGVSTAELYGHVKLSDAVNEQGAADGVAATPKAVNDVKATIAEIDQGLDAAETNIQTLQNWQNATNSTLTTINEKDQEQDTSISGLQAQINNLGTGAKISPTDYVVAQGTSGIWAYQKYNSGRAICYGQIAKTSEFNINTLWGSNFYTSPAIGLNAYPFTFIDKPKEICMIKVMSPGNTSTVYTAFQSCHAQNTKTQTGSYEALRSGSGTGFAAEVTFMVEGRWK